MNGHLAVSGLLKQSTELAGLVALRIYPDVMPDSPTYPAITYQKMGGKSARGSTSDPTLMSAVFQVSAWAKSRIECTSIIVQVRKTMDRKRKITVADVAIDDCFYEDDIDLFDQTTRIYFNHCTFKIFYRDPA